MRYVVRNNFFGLESRPQNQEGLKDRPTPAILTGEHEGRQEQQSEEDGVEPRSASLVRGMRSSAEDLETSEAVVADQNCQDQVLQNDQVYSEPSEDPVDSAAKAEQVAGDFIRYAEDTAAKEGHSLDLMSTDKITCTSNIYDDEIW